MQLNKSRRRRVYHPQFIAVYHQCVSIVYHQAEDRYTLPRDEIQPEGLMICTALRAAMICQACGLDKKHVRTDKFLASLRTRRIVVAYRLG